MTSRIRQASGGWRQVDNVLGQHLQSVSRTAVLLALCAVVAACGIRTGTFELSPRTMANPSVHASHVGVVVEKAFVPYKIKFRYWSTAPFTWSLDGLPDAFVKTLSAHFLSAEPIGSTRSVATGPHDLIARMSVDRLHFDGANTTVGIDTVDLTMTFTLERPNGTEVFRRSLSATASSPYRQACAFCKPDPPEAFTKAFAAVFAQLSETLSAADIRLDHQETRQIAAGDPSTDNQNPKTTAARRIVSSR